MTSYPVQASVFSNNPDCTTPSPRYRPRNTNRPIKTNQEAGGRLLLTDKCQLHGSECKQCIERWLAGNHFILLLHPLDKYRYT